MHSHGYLAVATAFLISGSAGSAQMAGQDETRKAPLMPGSATLSLPAVAQDIAAGSISGRVLDAAGGPVSGATVTATSGDGAPRIATTSATGSFVITRVPDGFYDITVTAEGQPTLRYEDVQVLFGGTFNNLVFIGGEAMGLYVVRAVNEPAEVARRIKRFDENLKYTGFGGRIRTCNLMVDVTMGRKNSNHSYGAVCEITRGRGKAEALLCNDDIVGHFALTTAFQEHRDSVAAFTFRKCTGG